MQPRTLCSTDLVRITKQQLHLYYEKGGGQVAQLWWKCIKRQSWKFYTAAHPPLQYKSTIEHSIEKFTVSALPEPQKALKNVSLGQMMWSQQL